MPRRARICGVIGCGRMHYALGFCRKCYDAEKRKKARRRAQQASRPTRDVLAALSAAPDAVKKGVSV